MCSPTFAPYSSQPTAEPTPTINPPPNFNWAAFSIDGRGGTFVTPAGTYNIGIACGAEYGLLAMDVDVKNGAHGLTTLQTLDIDGMTLKEANGAIAEYCRPRPR